MYVWDKIESYRLKVFFIEEKQKNGAFELSIELCPSSLARVFLRLKKKVKKYSKQNESESEEEVERERGRL